MDNLSIISSFHDEIAKGKINIADAVKYVAANPIHISVLLYYSIYYHHYPLFTQLIAIAPNLDSPTAIPNWSEPISPLLILASLRGHSEIFKALIAKASNVCEIGFIGYSKLKQNRIENNILGAACYNGCVAIVDQILALSKDSLLALLECPTTEKLGDKDKTAEMEGFTPLLLSIANRHHEITTRLIQAGASSNAKDSGNNNALHICAKYTNVEAVEMLLELNKGLAYENNKAVYC
jgi:ankyrin repeat protein